MSGRAHIALVIGAATLLLAAAPLPPAVAPIPITSKPCFGAASRDPARRCVDRSLRATVIPPPAEAALEPNAPCVPTGRTRVLYPCAFGVRAAAAGAPQRTIALVGDSHASAWRAAVAVVAERKGVPAVSLARSRCPFIDARVRLARADAVRCRDWNRAVKDYLVGHPQIDTLFIANRSSAEFEPAAGKDDFETQIAGHIALWDSLPASIAHVVVIRDTPRGSAASARCVRRAFDARRVDPGGLCARPRAQALHVDPAILAARRLNSPRVRAIDLSHFFCDPRRCFPVVGGAAVYRNVDHMSAGFARTLGPFLLRAYNEVLGSGAR